MILPKKLVFAHTQFITKQTSQSFLTCGPWKVFGADPIFFFFSNEDFFPFFAAKLGLFTISLFIYVCNKTLKLNSKNRKTKKKKFYRIGYWAGIHIVARGNF